MGWWKDGGTGTTSEAVSVVDVTPLGATVSDVGGPTPSAKEEKEEIRSVSHRPDVDVFSDLTTLRGNRRKCKTFIRLLQGPDVQD